MALAYRQARRIGEYAANSGRDGMNRRIIRGGVFALCLFGAFGMLGYVGNAWCADEELPPEVKSLIGIKVMPTSSGKRAEIPGCSVLWGSMIDNQKGYEVIQCNKVATLVIEHFINQTSTILDARVIPGKQLRFYLEDGKLRWRKNEMRWYRITADCSREDSGKKETILGMWKFKPDSKCTDPSSLVKKAWLLDPSNGHLTEILTQGVSCREPDCGDE